MLQIKPMTIKDEAQVMEMVRDFYHSDAVGSRSRRSGAAQNLFRRGGSGTELVGIGSVGMAARRLVSAISPAFTPASAGERP